MTFRAMLRLMAAVAVLPVALLGTVACGPGSADPVALNLAVTHHFHKGSDGDYPEQAAGAARTFNAKTAPVGTGAGTPAAEPADAFEVVLQSGYVTIAQVALVPCAADAATVASARLGRALGQLGLMSAALAHGDSNPTTLAVPTVENLLAADLALTSIGTLNPPVGSYCQMWVTLGPADADAQNLPHPHDHDHDGHADHDASAHHDDHGSHDDHDDHESHDDDHDSDDDDHHPEDEHHDDDVSPMLNTTVRLTGTAKALGTEAGAAAEPVAFTLASAGRAAAKLVDFTDAPVVLDADRREATLVIGMAYNGWLDGVDLAAGGEAAAQKLLANAAASLHRHKLASDAVVPPAGGDDSSGGDGGHNHGDHSH